VVASAEDVDMEMIDRLASIGPGIDHHAVAVSQAFVAGNLRGRQQHVAEQRGMFLAGVRQGGDMFAGHHQKVHRRLRIDIAEGAAQLVLVDGLGGDGALGDLAEQAAHRDQCTGAPGRATPVQLESLCPASYGSKWVPFNSRRDRDETKSDLEVRS
jgi:hypothetical protein